MTTVTVTNNFTGRKKTKILTIGENTKSLHRPAWDSSGGWKAVCFWYTYGGRTPYLIGGLRRAKNNVE